MLLLVHFCENSFKSIHYVAYDTYVCIYVFIDFGKVGIELDDSRAFSVFGSVACSSVAATHAYAENQIRFFICKRGSIVTVHSLHSEESIV